MNRKYYSITFIDRNSDTNHIEEIRSLFEDAARAVDSEGDENDPVDWMDIKEDLCGYTKDNTGILISVKTDDQCGNEWFTHYKNGRYQICQAVVWYPDIQSNQWTELGENQQFEHQDKFAGLSTKELYLCTMATAKASKISRADVPVTKKNLLDALRQHEKEGMGGLGVGLAFFHNAMSDKTSEMVGDILIEYGRILTIYREE